MRRVECIDGMKIIVDDTIKNDLLCPRCKPTKIELAGNSRGDLLCKTCGKTLAWRIK